jgi:restriction endonuclease Mrr
VAKAILVLWKWLTFYDWREKRRKEKEEQEQRRREAEEQEREKQRKYQEEEDRRRREAEEQEREKRRKYQEEEDRRRREAKELAARGKWRQYYESKSMDEVSRMTGREFEELLVRLFGMMGYTEISLTPANDQGGDLLCLSPSRLAIVIQAKRWTGSVGNGAVQELLGAMRRYNRSEGMVVTNSTFTKAARELAQTGSDITLCDGQWLEEQIRKWFPSQAPQFSWEEYNRLVKDWNPVSD